MATVASGEAVLAKQSQESHLLSPEISAAGSDSGQLEDLKGESLSELVEAEPHSLAEGAGAAAAATPCSRQQTSLKKPALIANPGTCSTSTSKSKTHPPETSQKPAAKIDNTKMSSKAALSASRRAAPINIQIVRLASSSSSSSSPAVPSSSAAPQNSNGPDSRYGQSHSFTMNMLPMTKIRELCLHAAGHARRNLDVVLDGSRFEARDRDGHVFKGHETISEEVLSGETIYLVEGGLDARRAAKGGKGSSESKTPSRSGARERGRLLCLKSLELEGEGEQEGPAKTPYRTPSVSSRASSSRSDSKGKAAQPRMTPSQRALAIAMGRTPTAPEPPVERKPLTSSVVRKSLPSPALEIVGESPAGEEDVAEPADSDDVEADSVSASPPRSPSPPPRKTQPQTQPQKQTEQQVIPPNLQDSQLVIPDSQDPFSQGAFSQQTVKSEHPAPAHPMLDTPDTSDAPVAQSRPAPRVKPTTTQRKQPTSRPDPYDINTVLSDEDDEPSDGSSTNTTANKKMATSVRKLGSSTAKRQPVAPPPVSLPSAHRHRSHEASPLRADKSPVPAARSKTSTPTKKPTPVKTEPSSPAVPLPSSPTTHVAAAIAREGNRPADKSRQRRLPSPGRLVIPVPSDSGSDSDDDLIEEAFRDLSSSIPPSSLPWSEPPLRAAPDAQNGVDKQSAPSRSVTDSAAEVKYGTLLEDDLAIVGVSPKKSPPKGPSKGPSKSPLKKPPEPPKSAGEKSSQKSPTKAPIITSPSKKEDATIVHDSSSAEESDKEEDVQVIKKEPLSSQESPRRNKRLPDTPIVDEKSHRGKEEQLPMIELSSDSDTDIEPSTDMLEDDEAELPSIDVELLTEKQQLPSLPRSPARADQLPTRNSPEIDPVKMEAASEEPPPLAQTSKRKRAASEEPESEDENRRKRRRKEAKKVRSKRKSEQKAALALQDERERQLAAEQEDRKKLALENAHRRALELEIIVSSPTKRESSVEPSVEGGDDDDSGLGSSAHGDNAAADTGRAGVPLDGDDKNDSLSSKEAEGDHHHHPSWRKVSKLHLSSSLPGVSQDGQAAAPPTSTPAAIEAQLQQCVEERFHRMPFDDWAFLESTLGRGMGGGHGGYSPLEVHNRVHSGMVRRAQHPPRRVLGEAESKPAALPDDDMAARTRSQRSEAPSPKDHRASEEKTTKARGGPPQEKKIRKKRKEKGREKLRMERERRRELRRSANSRYHREYREFRQFRMSRLDEGRKRKQQHKKQMGH